MDRFYKQFHECIQKEVPFCQASCPFHVDITDFIEKVGRNAYNAAYKTYKNAVTFPGIVAALCHEPCKSNCPRGETPMGGDPIELRGLERTTIEQTKNKEPIFYNVPKKDRSIAIIGAGVSGLACALRLASKKYNVAVFEASDRIGGHLWEIADGGPDVGGLTPDMFLEEFDLQLKHEDIPIHFNRKILDLEQLNTGNYDAVYIATGAGGKDFGVLKNNPLVKGNVAHFAGGSLKKDNTIEAIADGNRAALAIEAYLKTGNAIYPDDSRETRVRVDPSKVDYKKGPILDGNGMVASVDVKAESQRCLKCQCDSCKIYCDLVAYTNKWPLRIKDEVQATMHEGQADIKAQPAKRLINICTHCGLCDDVCPAQIDMDSMFLQARKELHRLDRMPWAFHDFWLRDMEFADGEFAAIIKSPPGIKMSKYAFFPGCQLGASDPRYVREAYSRLLDIDPTTALFLKCCGTPVKWSGNEEKHAETIAKLRADWESLGRPELIIACPSCINNINEFLAEAKTISLYEYMDMEGVIPVSADDISAWSVFDPCASTGNDGMRKSVRNLAEKAGLILEPLPVQEDHTACCSYGGRVSTANPEFADFVVNRRITESSNPYITYCINCRDIFLDAGKETIHILDILFGEGKKLNNCGKKLPTVTERRNNRYELKKQLLRDVWGDDIVNEKPQINIDLKIGPEMKDKLNKEHILEEEIANVIEFCESTGRTVHMAENDTFGGYRKIGYMTYWVEYKKNGKKFELINAYSHRMSIDLEAVWNGKKVEIDL